jgi:flagellar basal-body rod modification protein FlgD
MDNLATKYEMARYFDLIGQQVFLNIDNEVVAGVVGGVILTDGKPSFYLQGDPDAKHYTFEQLLSVVGGTNYDMINYLPLVGHSVVVQNGSSEVTGIVEKIIMQDGRVAVWVNGAAYGIDLIKEVHGITEETSTEPEETEPIPPDETTPPEETEPVPPEEETTTPG